MNVLAEYLHRHSVYVLQDWHCVYSLARLKLYIAGLRQADVDPKTPQDFIGAIRPWH